MTIVKRLSLLMFIVLMTISSQTHAWFMSPSHVLSVVKSCICKHPYAAALSLGAILATSYLASKGYWPTSFWGQHDKPSRTIISRANVFESVMGRPEEELRAIDAIRFEAVKALQPFGGHLPRGYGYDNPYPQLLSQSLCVNDADAINRMIDDVTKNDVNADRSVGALMGLVIGDAVGAPLEFLPAQTKISYLSVDSNNKLQYALLKNKLGLKPGQWTDDGSMALCLADSLIVSGTRPLVENPQARPGCYDGSDCRIRYYLWWNTGYNNAFVYDDRRASVGLGGNIAKSFKEIAANPKHVPAIFNAGGNDAGNGSIMRNVPVAIRFSTNMAEGIDAAMLQSKGTHPGEDAAACCAFMTYITIKAIQRDRSQTDIKTFIDTTIASFLHEIGAKQRENPGFKNLENVLNSCSPSPKEAVWNWKNDSLAIEKTLEARGKVYNGYPVSAGYFGSYCMDGLAMALGVI